MSFQQQHQQQEAMSVLRLMRTLLLLCCVSVRTAATETLPSARERWYVKAGESGDCKSLNSACGRIQKAIDLAGPGDTIFVLEGTYEENLVIKAQKRALVVKNYPDNKVIVQAAGEANPAAEAVEAAAVLPSMYTSADVIIDIFAPQTKIQGITLVHPDGVSQSRDIGVYVRPSAAGTTLSELTVERHRIGEPSNAPGSRGLLVIGAPGVICIKSSFSGFQDNIHLATSTAQILYNKVLDAQRMGIAIVQDSNTEQSSQNVIWDNTVQASGSDGIQVDGDNNLVLGNTVIGSVGYGIHICGLHTGCISKAEEKKQASANVIKDNSIEQSGINAIGDFGAGTSVEINQ